MESVIEIQRRYHEERERLEDSLVKELCYKKKNRNDEINSGHRVILFLDRYFETSSKLKELYEDKDRMRSEEISLLSGVGEFSEFYNRLKNIKEYHKKFPNSLADTLSFEFNNYKELRENPPTDTDMLVSFSDEEGLGKYIDIHRFYDMYINLMGKTNLNPMEQGPIISQQMNSAPSIDYLSYLSSFDKLYEIPLDIKSKKEYMEYLDSIIDYLKDFIFRAQPLIDVDSELIDAVNEFEKQWKSNKFIGWNHINSTSNHVESNSKSKFDLENIKNLDDLLKLQFDELKNLCQSLGLKCGGTLTEKATRILDYKNKADTPKLKPNKTKFEKETEYFINIARQESKIYRLIDLITEERQSTRENVERKQARTADELAAEDEEQFIAEAKPQTYSDDDDDEGALYNPKNLPIGPDGKPIPYWLYKLHGLNQYYNCEICGNCKYRGPKDFQKHFAEWRHAHGMRCLGIPNTAHFANITKIEDAIRLWDVLRQKRNTDNWTGDVDEECEDSNGNVVNRKTFEDLRRQGLL